MKHSKLILILVTLFLITDCCDAQQLVKSVTDAPKILLNKNQFIGKPLKDFLKEIKPEFKNATANPSAYSEHPDIGYFNFKFVNTKQNDSLRLKGRIPVTITVYVKGPFEWNTDERRNKNFIWTKEDESKYGNLIVKAFRVYGQ